MNICLMSLWGCSNNPGTHKQIEEENWIVRGKLDLCKTLICVPQKPIHVYLGYTLFGAHIMFSVCQTLRVQYTHYSPAVLGVIWELTLAIWDQKRRMLPFSKVIEPCKCASNATKTNIRTVLHFQKRCK